MSTERAPLIVIGNTEDLLLDQLCEHTFDLDDLSAVGIGQKTQNHT